MNTHTCPTNHTNDAGDDLVGCGATFEAVPDDEGYVDCPECGMWFVPVVVVPFVLYDPTAA